MSLTIICDFLKPIIAYYTSKDSDQFMGKKHNFKVFIAREQTKNIITECQGLGFSYS